MKIGIPKEIKPDERRVGLTPDSVRELTRAGHELLVETGAGLGIGATDAAYVAAGAKILPSAKPVFDSADLIVKVKEPQLTECALMHPGQVIFTYLHLAADPTQTRMLVDSGSTCIAYETVTDVRGALPLLAPMSEVAGRMSIQEGAHYLVKAEGGSGVLLVNEDTRSRSASSDAQRGVRGTVCNGS